MGFKCGIVGLPNVGKSTLFNAVTQTAAAQVANYPFCTIEPNVGEVAVPDPRLVDLAKIANSAEIVPTRLTFVDIAGLVRGASKGEGLGNQFLAHIREVDAVAHVLRCFEDADVTHVEAGIDPVRDAETVETELMLADLESLEKRTSVLEKNARGGDKEAVMTLDLMRRAIELLSAGKPARALPRKPEEEQAFHMLNLITAMPVLYVCNVDEASAATGNAFSKRIRSARPRAAAQARGRAGVPYAQPHHRDAGALCLQRRRGFRRDRQRLFQAYPICPPARCRASPRKSRRSICSTSSRRCRCSMSATSTRLPPRPATPFPSVSRPRPPPRARALSSSPPRSRRRSPCFPRPSAPNT